MSKPSGADKIPAEKLDEVLKLLKSGDKTQASILLESLATRYSLLTYEVHHLALCLFNKAKEK